MNVKILKKWLVIVLLLSNIYVWHLIFEFYFLKSSVNFLNVFEGDSALIINKSGNFLIDAGRRNYVSKPLSLMLPFFDNIIDVVFVSHADSDHFEGLNYILDNYKVRLVVLNDFENDNENYQKILKKIIDHNITIISGVSNTIVEGFGFKTEVLYPDISDLSLKSTNEKSQVMLVNTVGKKILFTGDITDKILNKVVNKWDIENIDIIKIPHHGAKNTINREILSQIGVKQAVISVGDNNYGHPNTETLDLLKNFNIEVFRTDINGNISIK